MDDRQSLIALPQALVVATLAPFVERWDSGGKERSRTAFEADAKAELLEAAPKETGFLWWRRPTTRIERNAWMERAWEEGDKGWHECNWDGLRAHMVSQSRLQAREGRVNDLRRLLKAAEASPATATLYVDADEWEYAHRQF